MTPINKLTNFVELGNPKNVITKNLIENVALVLKNLFKTLHNMHFLWNSQIQKMRVLEKKGNLAVFTVKLIYLSKTFIFIIS